MSVRSATNINKDHGMWEITFNDGPNRHHALLYFKDDNENHAVLEIEDPYPQFIVFQNKAICTSIGEPDDWDFLLSVGNRIVDIEFATSVATDILNGE